jgi:hypothetical protein
MLGQLCFDDWFDEFYTGGRHGERSITGRWYDECLILLDQGYIQASVLAAQGILFGMSSSSRACEADYRAVRSYYYISSWSLQRLITGSRCCFDPEREVEVIERGFRNRSSVDLLADLTGGLDWKHRRVLFCDETDR